MGASGTYGSALSDEERFAFLDEAYKKGERFWDTGKRPHGLFISKSNLSSPKVKY
jgi:hypothetical protein